MAGAAECFLSGVCGRGFGRLPEQRPEGDQGELRQRGFQEGLTATQDRGGTTRALFPVPQGGWHGQRVCRGVTQSDVGFKRTPLVAVGERPRGAKGRHREPSGEAAPTVQSRGAPEA